jgi:class 3 adenylate cyclase
MANYRTTVMLKTDIVDSTPRLAGQTQAEMGLQRKQHKRFIADIATKNLGSILQEEGDAYWIEFPSVTTAVLTAIEMHQNLRSMQTGKSEKQRLAIRAIITVGDILHQERDTIGTTMSLTARIEKVTPPGEIYLSHAAWLVLNKAEVQTSFVNEFSFKGFHEPEKVYKVEQKHSTRVITNQYIIFTDLAGWSKYILAKSVEEIEKFLLDYDDLLNEICENHNGVVRSATGDNYFLTFSDINQVLNAVEELCEQWKAIFHRHKIGLKIGIHKGNLNIFRSYIYSQSQDINTAAYMTQLNRVTDKDGFSIIVTGSIRKASQGTRWERKFVELDKNTIPEENILRRVVEEHGAYQFIVGDEL